MSSAAAVFLALVSGIVTVYLAALALFADLWRSTEGDSVLVHALWISVGVGVIVTACAGAEARLRRGA